MKPKGYEFNYLVFESCADTRYKLTSDWNLDEADRHILEAVAQEAADDFGENHDGHELTWPVMLRLEKLDGTVLGDFEVYREMEPRYTALMRSKPTQPHSPAPEGAVTAASETSES